MNFLTLKILGTENGTLKIKHCVYSYGPTSCVYSEYAKPLSAFFDCDVYAVKGNFDNYVRKVSLNDVGFVLDDKNSVFHFHSVHFVFLLLQCFFLKRKTVFTMHTSWNNYRLSHRVSATIFFLLCKKIVFVSDGAKKSIPGCLFRLIKSKSHTVNNAFDYTAASCGDKADQWVVCGRLEKVKRVDLAINFFLDNASSGEVLKIIGNGAEYERLSSLYHANVESGRVVFLGLLPRAEVYRLLASSKYYISMSKVEGLPVTVMEALSSGCICFVSDIPQHRIFEGFEAVHFVDPSFPASISESSMSVDHAILADKSRFIIGEKFGVKEFADKYRGIYESL